MLEELAIKFISWNLKRKGINNLEIVIRSDGNTVYKRNKEKEEYVKKILSKIKWNIYKYRVIEEEYMPTISMLIRKSKKEEQELKDKYLNKSVCLNRGKIGIVYR